MSEQELAVETTKPKQSKPKLKIFEKLKSIKHIEIILAVIFIIIMILIYMSSVDNKSATASNNDGTVTSYVDNLENRLENVLSNIKGVSKVSVVITLDMEGTSVNEKTQVVNMSSFPAIKGVVIVARGVDDVAVKLNLIKATQALFELPSGNIEVFLSK